MKNDDNQNIYIFLIMLLLIGTGVIPMIHGTMTDESQEEWRKGVCSGFTEPSVEWDVGFGGWGDQVGYAICQTSDGGYVVCGSSSRDGESNVLLAKITEDGVLEWTKLFDGNYMGGTALIETDDGGFVLTGVTAHNEDSTNVLLLKTDKYGSLLWKKSFDNDDLDAGMDIQETTSGNFIIVGYSGRAFAEINEMCDIWIITTDAEGTMIWDYIYDDAMFCMGLSVCETSDHGFAVVGEESLESGNSRIIVLELDETGKLLWKNSYDPGPSHDGANSVIESSDQHLIVAGYTHLQGSDGILYKINHQGNVLWSRIFEGRDYEDFQSVKETTDGGFILAGSTSNYEDVWIVRTNKEGYLIWEKTLEGSGRGRSYDIQQTMDYGYVVVGYTQSSTQDGQDSWVIKLDSDDATPPYIGLVTPKNAFYLNNKRVCSFPIALIVGSIDVEVQVSDEETGISDVQWYLDQEMVCSKTSEPFLWIWNEQHFGKAQVMVKAFDKAGNERSLSTTVWKFF